MILQRTTFFAMACENEVQVHADTAGAAQAAMQAVIAEVQRIESKYSRYRGDSIVSRINQAAGAAPVGIDAETAALFDYAAACFEQSDGLFDITSGVLRRVWNFKSGRPPERRAIDEVLPLIGWQRVERSAAAIRLPVSGMEIDFGGFGKEYAVDRAVQVLLARGIRHGCINLGGDLGVAGPHEDGSAWGAGIRHPRNDNALLATLPIYSGALATSGDYERYFDFQGRRYSHILDPRSGQPVQGFQSVTVHASSCLVAGSATTIAMLKGEKHGAAWLESLGLPWLAVRGNGGVASTFG